MNQTFSMEQRRPRLFRGAENPKLYFLLHAHVANIELLRSYRASRILPVLCRSRDLAPRAPQTSRRNPSPSAFRQSSCPSRPSPCCPPLRGRCKRESPKAWLQTWDVTTQKPEEAFKIVSMPHGSLEHLLLSLNVTYTSQIRRVPESSASSVSREGIVAEEA